MNLRKILSDFVVTIMLCYYVNKTALFSGDGNAYGDILQETVQILLIYWSTPPLLLFNTSNVAPVLVVEFPQNMYLHVCYQHRAFRMWINVCHVYTNTCKYMSKYMSHCKYCSVPGGMYFTDSFSERERNIKIFCLYEVTSMNHISLDNSAYSSNYFWWTYSYQIRFCANKIMWGVEYVGKKSMVGEGANCSSKQGRPTIGFRVPLWDNFSLNMPLKVQEIELSSLSHLVNFS